MTLSSLSEEELVEKLRDHLWSKAGKPIYGFTEEAQEILAAIGLSSILSRLEAAEGERDRSWETLGRLERALRLIVSNSHDSEAQDTARAALSTGDRHEPEIAASNETMEGSK